MIYPEVTSAETDGFYVKLLVGRAVRTGMLIKIFQHFTKINYGSVCMLSKS
jgi:hypothetical protein